GPGELLRLISRVYHRLNAPARSEFSSRGLTQEAYWVLRMLAEREPQRFDSLAVMIERGGRELQSETISDLEARGMLVTADDGHRLTDQGRRQMLELAAVHLATEEDALAGLDRSEADLLRKLLHRLFKSPTPES